MSLSLQFRNYRLTTAQILYHLPDYPGVLQSYVWQDYDIAPKYPMLQKFLNFWQRELEGRLHSVQVSSSGLVNPPSYRKLGTYLRLH